MALFNSILHQAILSHLTLRPEGVSWLTLLGSEAAMFFGLVNHTLTWNRLQRFLNDEVIDSFYFINCCMHGEDQL